MMIPRLNGIDHVHVYVRNWQDAEAWYGRVLGFRRVEKFMSWAVKNGPLTLEDVSGTVHLALFERADSPGHSTIAFNAGGAEFLAWKKHLEKQGLELRTTDHRLAWSLYFSDPDNNLHEITSYDHDYIRGELGQ
jgi:catechol 2,3-dioxygenase-like lactoylglutathione lyase family enzyme